MAYRSIEACDGGEWTIATWKKEAEGNPSLHQFRCRSWRHAGECRAACGACDFARCCDALARFPFWTYLILTYPAREWPNVEELFRFGVVHWSRLRKRIQRHYGKIKYIQTWEIHRSGYPHVNVVVSNRDLYEDACRNHFAVRHDVLDPMCHEVGFGFCKWCEPMRDDVRMAGYITKLGLELTGHAVKDQTPINAPKRFRRLRASQGTLPPRQHDPTLTGMLFKHNLDKVRSAIYGDALPPGAEESPNTLTPAGG